MNGLPFFSLANEEEYINKFCELYNDEIVTPDGFKVICKNPQDKARHFCCGGGSNSCFQIARANRIGWAKYILLNIDNRLVLFDNKSKYVIFFFEKNRTSYAVVCVPIKNQQLDLLSGFIVGGKRAQSYRDAKPPYSFYIIKKSC